MRVGHVMTEVGHSWLNVMTEGWGTLYFLGTLRFVPTDRPTDPGGLKKSVTHPSVSE